jgi:hypothetical protein
MGTARVAGRALVRIGRVDGQAVLVRMVPVGMVKMPVVEVIRMSVMDYSNVPASRAVCVSFEMFLVRAPKRDIRQRDNK